MKQPDEDRRIGGLVFVACMFIGAGIGLVFDRPDVGGAIGMGFGFLLMALIREKSVTSLTISLPRTFAQLSLIIVGVLMISCGFLLLYKPELVYPYLAGIAAILVGLLILLAGLIEFRRRE